MQKPGQIAPPPRRSLLITPADRFDRLKKALGLAADCTVLDLEDGVAPDAKTTARSCINKLLNSLPESSGLRRPEIMLRPGSLASGQLETDLNSIDITSLDALFIPKVDSADEVHHIEMLIGDAETAVGRDTPLPLILSIETPTGLFNATEIAGTGTRAQGLFFGSGDYAAITGIRISRETLLWPRSILTAAAAAAGLAFVDAAWFMDVKNAAATRADAEDARALGASGKLVFHPNQIAVANDVFSPGVDEIRRARRLINAWESAATHNAGTIYVDGDFVSIDILPPLRRLLSTAEQPGITVEEDS